MDIRLQRMADVLINYSLGLKKGDRLAINTGPVATPLIREIVRAAVRAGGYPEVFAELPGCRRSCSKRGPTSSSPPFPLSAA